MRFHFIMSIVCQSRLYYRVRYNRVRYGSGRGCKFLHDLQEKTSYQQNRKRVGAKWKIIYSERIWTWTLREMDKNPFVLWRWRLWPIAFIDPQECGYRFPTRCCADSKGSWFLLWKYCCMLRRVGWRTWPNASLSSPDDRRTLTKRV